MPWPRRMRVCQPSCEAGLPRPLCRSRNTLSGNPCKLSASACPHPAHRQADRPRTTTAARLSKTEAARAAALAAEISLSQPGLRALADAPMPETDTGLAADPSAFRSAINEVQSKISIDAAQVVHDYWLVRALHGVAVSLGADGTICREREGQQIRVGRWVFGGGTSLSAAWQITQRYSQDIDGILFVELKGVRKNTRHKACNDALVAAKGSLGATTHCTDGNQIRTTKVSMDGFENYLKFETTMLDADTAFVDKLVETREVTSILNQHCDHLDIGQYPEIGGFELLCARPAWTAVNKFDAVHRHAVQRNDQQLRNRGRDLYDLWAIAGSPYAADVRDQIPELWELAASGLRAPAKRPRYGYAYTEALELGTPANDILRTGYNDAVNDTVWSDAPSFEEALDAARSLDDCSDTS